MTQLDDIRNWQTLASYCRDQPQGQAVRTAPRFIRGDVCRFFTSIMYVPYTEDEVLQDFLGSAKKYCDAKFVITNWRNYVTLFETSIGRLPRFAGLSAGERETFLKAIRAMRSRMNVVIGGRTENQGGTIHVARTVAQEGEDTAMFALFHEIGHGVQTEGDIPQSAKDAVFTHRTETGARFGELFADAFAAIALSACGRTRQQIMNGAEKALADHGSDADHPDWPTRMANILAHL